MTPEDRFWYWINERHRIYLKKTGGAIPPWTSDPVLQNYKFTNVFRELDKTTVWVRENIRRYCEGPELLFMLALFRQTGTEKAGHLWIDMWERFGEFDAELWAHHAQEVGGGIFTGAYMVTGMFPDAKGKPKIVSLLKHAIRPIWDLRQWLYNLCRSTKRLREITEALSIFPGWGGNHFMAYEVACDLRYTPILEDAVDVMTWSNPGPGAQRGLCRIAGDDFSMGRGAGSRPKDLCIKEMQYLLEKSPKKLEPHVPPLELREIEHSLCEFDKYMRVLNGEGRPRSRYKGTGK